MNISDKTSHLRDTYHIQHTPEGPSITLNGFLVVIWASMTQFFSCFILKEGDENGGYEETRLFGKKGYWYMTQNNAVSVICPTAHDYKKQLLTYWYQNKILQMVLSIAFWRKKTFIFGFKFPFQYAAKEHFDMSVNTAFLCNVSKWRDTGVIASQINNLAVCLTTYPG